ncbi:MAG: hypothetical protein K8S87_09590 [Planctomycetes bacterium]|nr:hypothetical protein [Planctomycetota bacterium]
MNINRRIYILIACLIVMFPLKSAITDDEGNKAKLPKLLSIPEGFSIVDYDNNFDTKIHLVDAITKKELKLEIDVNEKTGLTPFNVNFKANQSLNIEIEDAEYFTREFIVTLKGDDVGKDIVIPCYPRFVMLKGEVMNPDGSIPEGVEIALNDELPANYYPGYHKIRNLIDAEGKYFLLLPITEVLDKVKLRIKTFKSKYDAELSLMQAQSVKTKDFTIPAYEVEIAMPDESLKAVDIAELLKNLSFESNSRLNFEQAYKIEQKAELEDYPLIISTYISSYKQAKDDATREFIRARLLPIVLDSIKYAEITNNIKLGLAYTRQAKEIFAENKTLAEFIEIFEYKNIPGALKSSLNDAFMEVESKNYVKAYYLLKTLSKEQKLTEKLRKKVVQAFFDTRDILIKGHLEKATNLYTNDEYLKSLWEIDKACKYSQDLPILKLLAERIISKLTKINSESEYSVPLRKNWHVNGGDFKVDRKLSFEQPGTQKWYLFSLENYSKLHFALHLRNINAVNYKLKVFLANETTLMPGNVVLSFDSNNIKLPDKKTQTRPTIPNKNKEGSKVPVKPGFEFELHKEDLGDFIFAEGKYFVSIQADDIENIKFPKAECSMLIDVTQIVDKDEMPIKRIKFGKDRESAKLLNQGFYASMKINAGASQWFKINSDSDKHIVLRFAGAEDFSKLTLKLFDSNNVSVNPIQKDLKTGEYVFKLSKQQYFVELVNKSSVDMGDIEFSMFLRFVESSLFAKDEVGLSFNNAIPLNPSKQLTSKVRRSMNMHYKFKVARKNYINITLYYNKFEGDIDMKIYSETKDKKREIVVGAANVKQNNRLYYRGYLEIGIYYVVVKSNALKAQTYNIRMYGGSTVISSGLKFQDPILIRADSKEYEIDINYKKNKWLQFGIDSFGELTIEYKISQGTIDDDEYNNVTLDFIGSREAEIITKKTFEDTKTITSMKKLIGKGLYHINLKNFTSNALKIIICCKFRPIDENISFENALKITTEPILGLIDVKSGTKRLFSLNVPKNGILQILSTFKFNKGDINLRLYDAKKSPVKSAETKSNDEVLTCQLEKGDYFLEIENITKGLENNINLFIDFCASNSPTSSADITSAQRWNVQIPEDINLQGKFDTEFSFIKTGWCSFRLNRKRRIQLAVETESPETDFSIKLLHGNEIIDKSTSAKGKTFIDSELEGGIYFVKFDTDSEEEIQCNILLDNYPSISSMRGVFDNITRKSATSISKSNIFPIIYQGEQSLWYEVAANTNTNNLEVSLYSEDEKHEFTLSLYDATKDEPDIVEFSTNYPVKLRKILSPGKIYYVKLEPVEPVQSSKIVLTFLVGPKRQFSNNVSYPYPLSTGKYENHKLSNNSGSFYTMCFSGRTKYKITCKFDNTNADIDLELQRINGEIISDSEGTGNMEIIDGEIDAGIYRLVVRYSDQYWGETVYTLEADFEITGELLSPTKMKDINTATWTNISREKAAQIKSDVLAKGKASSIPAWYVFSLNKNASVILEIKLDNDKGNLDLFLLNAQGHEIANSSTTNNLETLKKLCTQGLYFIRISSYNNPKANSFELTLRLEDVGGGHSQVSAIITKLQPTDVKDARKFEAKTEFTQKQQFPTWFMYVFEKPAWIQLEGTIKGGNGTGYLYFVKKSKEEDLKKDDTSEGEILGQLYLIDKNLNRWGRTENVMQKISIGIPAGTYYIKFTGNFLNGQTKITGTYLDGIDEMLKAPVISSGIFKDMTLAKKSKYWFKVKSSREFKIISSVYNETEVSNIKLSLHSQKIKISDSFKDTKTGIIFSEISAGEYFIMLENTSDKEINADFQIIVLDDIHPLGKCKMLKVNSKTSGKFERNSTSGEMFLIEIKEQSKVRISFKITDKNGYPSMNISRITLPESDKQRNAMRGSQGNTYEGNLDAGVYLIIVNNDYYYKETNFIIEFSISGGDFTE